MKSIILLFTFVTIYLSGIQAQTVTDYDSNVYNTIVISNKVWMKENLKVTHYNNGDPIPNVTDSIQWSNLFYGAYCNYNNSAAYVNTYGRLYNSYAVVDSRKLCPVGWSIPTEGDMLSLMTSLGYLAGGKLKETESTHWQLPNTGATNSTQFTALPAGSRISWLGFDLLGYRADFWTSSHDAVNSSLYSVTYNSAYLLISGGTTQKNNGFSVRCFTDITFGLNEKASLKDISIYPNPASDLINIDNVENQDLNVSVYNIIGDLVLERSIGIGTNKINIALLSKGIYILKIIGEDWAIQRKLIVN